MKQANKAGFKPQRGKFTLGKSETTIGTHKSFKPQRGKFTPKYPKASPASCVFQTPTG